MSIKEIFKNTIYESFAGNSNLSIQSILLILLVSCFIGIYIFFVYKLFSKSAFYSKDLNITLAGIVIIVSAMMIAMQASLIVSLGMVGALSIVRFRTAVKNPLDLLFLFWAITVGIINGVGLYVLALLLCCIMTILVFVLNKIPSFKAPILVVIRMKKNGDFDSVKSILKKYSKGMKEDSIVSKNNEKELIFELYVPDESCIMQELDKIQDIVSVNFLKHNGEMRI